MIWKTYTEFYTWLNEALTGWDVILGNSAESVSGETCFITYKNSDIQHSDDTPYISSTTYDLVFLSKRAAFTNRDVLEITTSGVDYSTYDSEIGYHIFTASVTLFGPDSIPAV